MGLLTHKLIKNEKHRFIIGLIKDLLILSLFIYAIIVHSYEWYNGYNACKELCIVFPDLNFSEYELFNYYHNITNLTFNITNYTSKSIGIK